MSAKTTSPVTTALQPFGVQLSPGAPDADPRSLPADLLRDLVRRERIVLLRGWSGIGSSDDLTDFCSGIGDLVEWPFGYVLELIEHANPQDHVFDHTYVPMHWDGMYMPVVPEFQVFQCVAAPATGDGGETTFADTTAILAGLDPRTLARWSEVKGTYRRTMEFYNSVTVAPLVDRHPRTGQPVMRYNEITPADDDTFVNHPDLEFSGLPAEELDRVHREVTAKLYDPAHLLAHRWETGDLVLTDNFTLLHGRNAFTAHAPRHLRRVHVSGIDNPHLVR